MKNAMVLALGPVQTWGFVDWIIAIIIVCACVGVLYIALNKFGVQIPQWIIQIVVICIVVVVAIAAIRFIAAQ